MSRIPIQDLSERTSSIIADVEGGEVFEIVRDGEVVAELRPVLVSGKRTNRLPNREDEIRKMPYLPDTGRIMEEDRI